MQLDESVALSIASERSLTNNFSAFGPNRLHKKTDYMTFYEKRTRVSVKGSSSFIEKMDPRVP